MMSQDRYRTVRALTIILAILFVIAPQKSAWAQKSPVVAKTDDLSLDDFYRIDRVQTIQLKVDQKEFDRMQAALPERVFVKASFRCGNVALDNVAIRFKGNSSSAPGQKHKRSFLIKFDEYEKDQQFLGLRRASLDNGVQFGSLFSEPIITEILREHGVKTHRANYAKLYINDQYHGVYINVERIDESFLERSFDDPNGMLFKVDEGGPAGNLQFVGDDLSPYKKTFEAETKSAKKKHAQLVDFIRMIEQSPKKDFAANLNAQMDVDDFLKITAVLLLSGAFDQLTGWNPHNYYLYQDSKNQRWHYLPWDLDVGFSETAFGQIQVLNDWNAAWPAPGQMPNPLLDRIVADPALLQKYRDIARTVLEKSFEPKRLCAVVDARYELIKADLRKDPFPPRRITNPDDRRYDDIVESIKAFIRKRYVTAREQLANPGKRPEMVRQPGGPPPQLVQKIQRIQNAAQQMQKDGKDLAPLQKVMQQVGPLLQQGKFDEAETRIADALKIIGDAP